MMIFSILTDEEKTMPHPYSELYLDDVIELQGKLFEKAADLTSEEGFEDFVNKFMSSKTRSYLDYAHPYVANMNKDELMQYYQEVDHYEFLPGTSNFGFMPRWLGEFYALYQWEGGISSEELIRQIPYENLVRAYPGLCDLDLKSAVKRTLNSFQKQDRE